MSGHMFSHWRQPMQSSIRTGSHLAFASSSRTFFGHTAIHNPQPLHQALLIVTSNFLANQFTLPQAKQFRDPEKTEPFFNDYDIPENDKQP